VNHRAPLRLDLALLATLAGAISCGSSSPAGGGSTTADQACADIATARCDQRSMCSSLAGASGPGASLIRNYGDVATCVARETMACKNGLAAPQTGNSPSKVEKCVGEYASFTCQDFFDNNPPADCFVTGGRANGAACAFNGQCSSGYCQGTKASICGTCAAAPSAGADCADSTCWHNQTCVSSSMTCETVVSMNGTCDSSHPCDNGLNCVGDTSTTTGTCQTAGMATGASCGGTLPGCDGTLGLYCAGTAGSKTCAALTFVGNGQACGAMADGTRVACIAGDCYTATGTAGTNEMGTCKALVDAPAACDRQLGPGCLAPARCIVTGTGTAGTCVVPTADMCPAT
jgi:hypothetical protein